MAAIRRGSALALATLALLLAVQPLLVRYGNNLAVIAGIVPVVLFALVMLWIGLRKDSDGRRRGEEVVVEPKEPSDPTEGSIHWSDSGGRR